MTSFSFQRQYRWYDYLIIGMEKCFSTLERTSSPALLTQRPNPGESIAEAVLSSHERQLSGCLMRINHTGEVCAQALYLGQSLVARQKTLRDAFAHAANEEADHLSWCEQRLNELDDRKSYLNPLWFTGSLLIGTAAGLVSDKVSLGFLAETERQVSSHLQTHLQKLPAQDAKSRAIVAKMQQEEANHVTTAIELGGQELPFLLKIMMRGLSKIMTHITYYV